MKCLTYRERSHREKSSFISSYDALTTLYREPFLGMETLLAWLFGFGAPTPNSETRERQ